MVSDRSVDVVCVCEGGGVENVDLPSPRPLLLQWFETFGTHDEGFLTHQ